MLRGVLIGAILLVLTSLFHYEILSLLTMFLKRVRVHHRAAIVGMVVILPLAHLICISMYAVAFYLIRDDFHLGTLGGVFKDSAGDYLYFSFETYASLGFGDIVPFGAARFLAGAETLNGLFLIAWSASFIFLLMQKYWELEIVKKDETPKT